MSTPELRPDIHVCLVSWQATPNITPLLDPAFRPVEVILLVTPSMQREAEWLRSTLQPTGVRVTDFPVEDAYDIEHITERLWGLLEQHHHSAIALNATGGTKPMSLAAYEVFRDFGKPAFYVHPHEDRVIWLHPHSTPSHQLADRIKLPTFLQAHGTRLVHEGHSGGITEPLRELTSTLVENVASFEKALAGLNWLAHSADANHRTPELPPHLARDGHFQRLVDLFQDAGVLRHEEGRLRFVDEATRFYANGGWLEQHVFSVLFGMQKRKRIQDIGTSIDVERESKKGPVPNELDVAFLADNRFYLIECKTKRWSNNGNPASEDNNALYRLDTLKELLGGMQGNAMLVSYRDIGAGMRRRAEDLGIAICAGQQITSLSHHLERWIR